MAFTPFVGSDEFSMANFNKAFNQLNDSKVDFASSQSLTDEQKARARGNINSAPGGFGLGDDVTTIPESANLNDYVKTGFFGSPSTSDIASWGNLPTNWPSNEAILEVYGVIAGRYAVQRLTSVTTKVTTQRSIVNSVWESWEWVNPRMELGVEYRTTERYLSKPVYVKLVDCGQLPNASEKTISGYAENVERVVDFNGISPYFGQSLMNKNFATLSVAVGWINIACTTDLSAGKAEVWVKYTKTTD